MSHAVSRSGQPVTQREGGCRCPVLATSFVEDVGRIIEGVIDIQAAAQGKPALHWFIGYDTDGAPMYCGNPLYIPHSAVCSCIFLNISCREDHSTSFLITLHN